MDLVECSTCNNKGTLTYNVGVKRTKFDREIVSLSSSDSDESDEELRGLCNSFTVKTPKSDGGGFLKGSGDHETLIL